MLRSVCPVGASLTSVCVSAVPAHDVVHLLHVSACLKQNRLACWHQVPVKLTQTEMTPLLLSQLIPNNGQTSILLVYTPLYQLSSFSLLLIASIFEMKWIMVMKMIHSIFSLSPWPLQNYCWDSGSVAVYLTLLVCTVGTAVMVYNRTKERASVCVCIVWGWACIQADVATDRMPPAALLLQPWAAPTHAVVLPRQNESVRPRNNVHIILVLTCQKGFCWDQVRQVVQVDPFTNIAI